MIRGQPFNAAIVQFALGVEQYNALRQAVKDSK